MTKRAPTDLSRGRLAKLTPESQARFLKAIGRGATYELACHYAGFSYGIYRNWMRQGQHEEEGTFRDFFNAVKRAEGKAIYKWLKIIDHAAENGEWQAAAWKLERRYWKFYSKHVEVVALSEEVDKIKNKYENRRSKHDIVQDSSVQVNVGETKCLS